MLLLCAGKRQGLTAEIAKDFAGRVVSRGAHDTAARMRARAAKVQTQNRRSILGPACDRTREKELVQAHVPMKDAPARQAVDSLEIYGRQYLPVEDQALETRGVLLDQI